MAVCLQTQQFEAKLKHLDVAATENPLYLLLLLLLLLLWLGGLYYGILEAKTP